ncbi:tyrosine-type recombinase/integrase [Amycolatopsis sp. cg5]|uniref:tyrosine-type recombinase/integrase n=1 Tax=Amycolatopsis sp. cg5 TaxID=3238802 RepID=UPI003523C369
MTTSTGNRAANLDAARLLLSSLGLTPQDLADTSPPRPPAPTFGMFVPKVAAAVSAGTRETYGPYWNYAVEAWGERPIDDVAPSEIKALAEHIKANVVIRRNGRGGNGAVENFIGALRCLYKLADDDELIEPGTSPAAKVAKPARGDSTRYALPPERLAEINHIGSTTGDDPELDALILRLHTETAGRRQGGLNLRPQDLDREQCLIYLREKANTVRWQPVSPTLMKHLVAHARTRHAVLPHQQLLRYRSGQPITTRRYDYLWKRIGQHLPWARAQGVSTHWLRHTTLTWVERNFNAAIARGYAGHSTNTSANTAGSISIYTKATLHEIATALATLTGEPHPLATGNAEFGGN